MNDDAIKEQISAFIDDEISEAEKALLIRRLENDPVLRNQLSRYQLMHDTINKHLPNEIDLNFSDRVMAVIDDESSYNSKPNLDIKKWLRPMAGMAVAASVAMLAIVGAQSLLLSGKPNNEDNFNTVASSNYQNMSKLRWSNNQAEVGKSLNSYLVNHNEYTSSLSIQGMLQYVRIAGFDLDDKQKEEKQKVKKQNKNSKSKE